MRNKSAVRTPEQAREWIKANGINITTFAQEHGISRFAVVDVLRGHRKGLRGDSHRAAIALGMKRNPKEIEL